MGPLRSAAETLSVEGGFVQRKSDRAAMTRAANRARLTGPGRPALPSGSHIRGEARMKTNSKGKQVCVVIGATSKWQSDGRNTILAHGHPVDDSDVEVGVRWGVGGAIAQKFAQEGFFTVVTTRSEANALPLAQAIRDQGGDCMIVELDLVSQESIANAFATIRREAGDPEVLIYNAGYLEGRDLPPEKELLEYVPVEMLDTGLHISARGPFLVAQEVLPAMRRTGTARFSS